MSEADRIKEEIGWLKVAFGICVALDASLVAWLAQNYVTAKPLIVVAASIAAVVIAVAVVVINRRAYMSNERFGEHLMEWAVILALVALVGAVCMVVYEASSHR